MNTQPSKWRYWLRFHLPNLIYLLVLIAVAGASYWLVKNNSDTAATDDNKNPELVSAFASGLEVSRTGKNGHVAYLVTAKEVLHYGTGNATVKNITVVATPKDGGPKVTATANDGVWNDKDHIVQLTGQVNVQRETAPDSDAMALTTEAASVDLYNDLASTELPFEYKRGASTITGTGFAYDYGLRNLKMGGQPNTRIKAVLINEVKPAK
jgi:LPS export ABC transporter protein LptC